jgi:hypothetical protein
VEPEQQRDVAPAPVMLLMFNINMMIQNRTNSNSFQFPCQISNYINHTEAKEKNTFVLYKKS